MRYRILSVLLLAVVIGLAGRSRGEEQQQQPPSQEPELTIVKYGSVIVKSEHPYVKVYIDDIYKGGVDEIIESVIVGEHVISCRAGGQSVTGKFQIKKNETLHLEAHLDDGVLVSVREAARAEPVKVEAEKKAAPVKKAIAEKPAVEVKKTEQKNPVEERRKNHLNVMRLDYEVNTAQDIEIDRTAAPAVSKFSVKKNQTGKYYRTKQGVLLCDAGPCELAWTASFLYTDEKGQADALLLNWKEIVFNGITPKGTSRRELECCLNGKCLKREDNSPTDIEQEVAVGRYDLHWTKTSVLVRRADIVKEIQDAGRSLADYQQ